MSAQNDRLSCSAVIDCVLDAVCVELLFILWWEGSLHRRQIGIKGYAG
jgi:hypothetical protein